MSSCKTKITYNGITTSLLTWTSTMDCWSFSLPAGKEGACPMSTKGGICKSCYAKGSRYILDNVARAQWTRFEWLKALLQTEEGRASFILIMVEALNKNVSNSYFRWFDSGDFFSPHLIDCVGEICRQTPNIRHWIPTRVYWPFL